MLKRFTNWLRVQLRMTGKYGRAYRRWKRIGCSEGIDAANRLTREEAHARR